MDDRVRVVFRDDHEPMTPERAREIVEAARRQRREERLTRWTIAAVRWGANAIARLAMWGRR